MYLLVFVNR